LEFLRGDPANSGEPEILADVSVLGTSYGRTEERRSIRNYLSVDFPFLARLLRLRTPISRVKRLGAAISSAISSARETGEERKVGECKKGSLLIKAIVRRDRAHGTLSFRVRRANGATSGD